MRKEFIPRKELLILIGVTLLFIVLLSATGLYFRNRKQPENAEKHKDIKVVEGVIATGNEPPGEESSETGQIVGSTAFFLKPTASEVLSALRDADPYGVENPDSERPPMKVMWPGYFFSLQEDKTGAAIVELDVDENGFGIVLRCLIKLSDYPEIRNLQMGQKIWVAGQVRSIDMEGTGTVTIDVEYVRFDEGPVTASPTETGS